MPKVETNRAKIIDHLKKDGWRLARHGGEHDIFSRSGAVIVVPRHRELSPGVARKIAKIAAWS